MGRRRDLLVVGVSVAMVLGVGVALVSFFVLSKDQRSEVLAVGGLAVAVVSGLVRVVVWLWRTRRPADPRPVGTLADLLAKAVYEQWRKGAAERMLLTPEPIPVSWSLSELPVAGPVEAAVGSADVAPNFPPLPDQVRVTEEQLRAGGGRRELFAVYAGIASGRMVVVGGPGQARPGPQCC
jgi:hypothetical protein